MMIDAVTKGGGRGSGIGCSRKLTETEQLQCADNQIYCWMRCMNFTEDVNPGSCAQKGLGLKCLSQRNQIWRPQDSHGDYNPTCTGVPDDQFVTPAPEFSPRDETACATGFEDFMGRSNYDHAVELEPGKHWFLWSVRDELLHAKLAYNDKVGYMAIGPENVGGGLGGMYGSHIVMGIVDPDNKADPLVFGAPWIGTSVNEYVIDESNSAFRHWSTPVARRLVESEINVTSCFTSMSFVTSNIAGVPLNLTAGSTNYFIWASHTKTHLKGYHGPMGRGHLEIVLNRDDGNEPSSGVTINYSACTLWTTLVIVISVWMS